MLEEEYSGQREHSRGGPATSCSTAALGTRLYPPRVPSVHPCSHLSFFESNQCSAAGTGPSKAMGATNPGTQPEEGQRGARRRPRGRGPLQAVPLTQPLSRHFQLTLSKAPQGKRLSQHSGHNPPRACLASQLSYGALEMAPPPLPLGLPSQGAKSQAGGQPRCLDLQWMGSYCLDSVCPTFSSRWSEFSRRGLLGMNMRHPGPHLTKWLGTIWADTCLGPLWAGRQTQQALATARGPRSSRGLSGLRTKLHTLHCPLSLSLIPKLNIKQDQAFFIGPAPEL